MGAVLDEAIAMQGIRSVALPAYCCHSMISPAEERQLAVSYYGVSASAGEGIVCDLDANEADAVVILDFFGVCHPRLRVERSARQVVIWDVTHSLFSSSEMLQADYCFGSLRKWAGFYTGGIAWKRSGCLLGSKAPKSTPFSRARRRAMSQKKAFIDGLNDSKSYLGLFAEAEEYLEDCGLLGADVDDVERVVRIDSLLIARQRRKNFLVLLDALPSWALFSELPEGDTPLFFPVLVDPAVRVELRAYLSSKDIFCPIHWPAPKDEARTLAPTLYSSELSLVCDQRYNEEDMNRIAEEVVSFLGV